MPGNPMVELASLGLGERQCFGFEALPHEVEQFDFLRSRKSAYLFL
jgi:hypothetical protein